MNQETRSKIRGIFRSRKFWAAVVGLVFIFLYELIPTFPLDPDQVTNIVYMIVAYILGVALDDAGQGIGGNPSF